MDKLTREVRKFIYDEFVATSHPPIAQRVADQFEISRSDAVHLFHILEKERQLTLIPGTDRIFMAHPFSAVATPFRCRLRTGREYFINCSFDTLACYATLAGAPMTISSFCHRTGTQIEIMLNCRKVEWFHPEGTVVYLGIPARHWWRNIIDTCGNQFLFFASEAEARLWEQETEKRPRSFDFDRDMLESGRTHLSRQTKARLSTPHRRKPEPPPREARSAR